MDTAESKIARLERSIARAGQTVLFERLSTDSATGASIIEMSVSVPAWTRTSFPQDFIDNDARDIRIVVSPTVLFGTEIGSPPQVFGLPKRDDRTIIEGEVANIQQIMPIYYNGEIVRINLLCRGAPLS